MVGTEQVMWLRSCQDSSGQVRSIKSRGSAKVRSGQVCSVRSVQDVSVPIKFSWVRSGQVMFVMSGQSTSVWSREFRFGHVVPGCQVGQVGQLSLDPVRLVHSGQAGQFRSVRSGHAGYVNFVQFRSVRQDQVN